MIATSQIPRVAYVSAVGETGGGERVLMELARGAIQSGWSAEVFCLRDGAWARGGWGTDVKINTFRSGYRIRYPWSIMRAATWLRRRLSEFGPTVIHANHASWWITAWAARHCDASTVWHLHDYPNHRDLPTRVGVQFPPKATLFTTRHVASGYPELARSDHAVIAPATVDVDAFRASDRDHGILKTCHLENQGYFLTVSRWQPHKGLHDLVDAVALGIQSAGRQNESSLKTIKHVIVGKPNDDAERQYQQTVLRDMTDKGVRNQFVLIPGCTDDQLRALYSSARALVHPAHSEGFGLVLLEAMSLGVPVIACDAAGPTEILNCPNAGIPNAGILVQRGCPEQLADAMRSMLNDADKRNQIGKAGSNRVAQLSRDEMIRQTLAFYESLQPTS